MKRTLFLIAILFLCCLSVSAQVNSQRVIYTASNPPTSCVPGKVVTNPSLNPAKAWVGTSTGACTEIDASAAAPANATYITQTPNATLTNEQALSLLATGIPLITTTTGVISISSVTNDVQTKASIVPNTTPSAGQILAGNAGGTAYAPVTLSGSGATATLSSAGVLTLSGIANATLSNSAITINGTSVSLGGTRSLSLASADFANQGTTTTVLHGAAAGNPSFGAVVSADLNITTTTCTNQFLTAISATGTGTCTTDTLAGAQHANQGTTTTVLHGNAGGNPSFGAVALGTDVSGTLLAAQEPAHTGDVTNSAGSLALTIAANAVTLTKLATQATNTVLGNATSGTAVPTALAVGTCSTAGSALNWTTNTGFGCNTSITAAAAPVSGLTGAGTGVLTALAINVGSAGAPVTFNGALGTPSSGTVTNFTGTASININGTVGATTPTTGAFTTIAGSGVETLTDTTAADTKNFIYQNTSAADSQTTAIFLSNKNAAATQSNVSIEISSATGVNGSFAVRTGGSGNNSFGTQRFIIGPAGTITLSTAVTNAAGTPGSICYNTSTFEMTKNNALTCTVSSRDYKQDITDLRPESAFDKLRPVEFAYRDHADRLRWGFIAEEAAEADRRFADGYDKNGVARSLDQNGILAATVAELQLLKVRVAELEKKLEPRP